jgi:hypothetical protein
MLGNNHFELIMFYFYILFCSVIAVLRCNDIGEGICFQDTYFTVTCKQIGAGKNTQNVGYMKKNRGTLV